MANFNVSPSASTRHVADAASAAQILASVLTKHQADFGPGTPAADLIEINAAMSALLIAADKISFSCTTASSSSTNLSHHAGQNTLHGNEPTRAVMAEMQGRK